MENLKIYTELSKINVNDHIEKKNGLSYLSWSWAIDYMEKFCDANGLDLEYGIDGIGADGLVYSHVTINGKTKRMWLPVMDYRNRTIDEPSTMDINKTYMRCLVKNFALWGLGAYIYSGEDLPQDDTKVETPKVEMITDSIWEDLKKAYSKEEIKEMYKELGITSGKNIPMAYAKAKIDAFLKDNSKMPVKEFY